MEKTLINSFAGLTITFPKDMASYLPQDQLARLVLIFAKLNPCVMGCTITFPKNINGLNYG